MEALFKKLLFRLEPETAHQLSLKLLKFSHQLGLIKNKFSSHSFTTCMGIEFPNRIGLAAGMDKNGDYIDALGALGFGFIEVGTVTPLPQKGNPKPRLFRLAKQEAIINRLGFNNKGVDYLISRLQKKTYSGILGVNIGKNAFTPVNNAIDDYKICFNKILPFADYIAINISSPNTEGLRTLQQTEYLSPLLKELKGEQNLFFRQTNKYVPLVVKISPDLAASELNEMAEVFLHEKIDGVIATNTTLSRAGVEGSPFKKEIGGLSGKPLTNKSTFLIKRLSEQLDNQIPIIGCGGIFSTADAKEKVAAGASLIQVYSGFVYRGISLIQSLLSVSNE